MSRRFGPSIQLATAGVNVGSKDDFFSQSVFESLEQTAVTPSTGADSGSSGRSRVGRRRVSVTALLSGREERWTTDHPIALAAARAIARSGRLATPAPSGLPGGRFNSPTPSLVRDALHVFGTPRTHGSHFEVGEPRPEGLHSVTHRELARLELRSDVDRRACSLSKPEMMVPDAVSGTFIRVRCRRHRRRDPTFTSEAWKAFRRKMRPTWLEVAMPVDLIDLELGVLRGLTAQSSRDGIRSRDYTGTPIRTLLTRERLAMWTGPALPSSSARDETDLHMP